MIKTYALKPGDDVRLVDFGQTAHPYRRRLLALGVTRGVDVKVIRRAPLGCPLQIEVRGVSLTLREDEAQYLLWEYLSCASS